MAKNICSMRQLILRLFVIILCGVSWAGAKTDKPNIVFILVDDLGYADVGFNGSVYYETPNIDKLAGEGLVFEYAYMYPTCSPSRAALATGKQSFRTGVYTVPVLERGSDQENIFSRWTVGTEHTMYSEPLAEAGYQAIHLGKWHLVGPYPEKEMQYSWPIKKKLRQPATSDFSWVPYHKQHCKQYYPEGRGYLKNIGGTYRGDPALEVGGYQSKTGGYFAPFNNPFLPEKNPEDKWLTDYLTTKAIKFMEANKESPFFINLHYYTVHRPLRARSDTLRKKYMDKPSDPKLGQGCGERKPRYAEYASMIESLDDNIGRIVKFLEQNNLRKNTLIIFTSDNGHNEKCSINHQMRGSKGHIYEGGIRVPAFVNWPGKVKSRRTETPIMAVDFFPTFMDLAGIDYQGVMDGQSFACLFDGTEDKALRERPIYWHLASQWKHGTCSVIRQHHMKLIQLLTDGRLELYDLKKDPKESHNLINELPETGQQLCRKLMEWRKENDVSLPPNSSLPY